MAASSLASLSSRFKVDLRVIIVAVVLLAVPRLVSGQKLSASRCARLSDPGRTYCMQFVGARDSYSKYKSAMEWARYATDTCESFAWPSRADAAAGRVAAGRLRCMHWCACIYAACVGLEDSSANSQLSAFSLTSTGSARTAVLCLLPLSQSPARGSPRSASTTTSRAQGPSTPAAVLRRTTRLVGPTRRLLQTASRASATVSDQHQEQQ